MGSMRGYLSAGVALARDAFLRFGGTQSPVATRARFQFVHRAPFVIPAPPREELSIGTSTESYRESLRAAIKGQRINVDYAPVVSLATDEIIRFEAVPRWKTDNGWITSDDLIAFAERMGLATELDHQVLSQACQDASKWPKGKPVAVRVSSVQSQASSLNSLVSAALENSGLESERLNLELVEAALVEQEDSLGELVSQLRRLGVKVALDDFGTGYASLNQLLHLQFDRLKIDRKFVAGLDTDVDCAIIVRAIVRLANDFGIQVTAKGVKTAEQVSKLVASGCEEGQGPLFGKFLSLTEIHALLGEVDGIGPTWRQKRIH